MTSPRDVSSVRLQVNSKAFERARECLNEDIQQNVSVGMTFWNTSTSNLCIRIQSALGSAVGRGEIR